MSNWEENEYLRQEFIDKTKKKLYENPSEDNYYFSDEYVFWLEAIVLETDYKDKIDTLIMIVDIEKECECTEYKKCGLCKLVDRYELIDIEDGKST